MQTSIDFSKIARIEPMSDSWDKVCARLDAKASKKTSLFHIYSVIPLAASFILISLAVLLTFFKPAEQQQQLQIIPNDATATWFNTLGEIDEEAIDDLALYKSITLLMTEGK